MRAAGIPMIVAALCLAAGFESQILDNGLEIVVSADRTAPVVTICIAVRTGATCEEPETNGLAHFYEHMFFKGNESLPDQTAYNHRLRELGIVRNGTTSDEMVKYYVTISSDRFEEGLEFMRDAIVTPLFDMEEMAREREVIMNEYDRNTTHAFWQFRLAQEAVLCSDAPWRASTIGEPEVIMAANPSAMYDFQERYYTPDNSVLIITGDIDPREAFALAEEYFSVWVFGGRSNYDDLSVLLSINSDTTVYVDSPSGIGFVSIVYAGPPFGTDPSSSYPADVWGTYLDLMSRDFHRTLVTNGPFITVGGSYYTQRYYPSISFSGMFPPDQTEEAVAALRAEIEKLDQIDFYDDEGIALAKDELRRHRLFAEESARDLALNSLAFWWVQGNGLDYYSTYLDSLAGVETEDITEFVNAYISGRPSATFIMRPENSREEM